MDDHAADPRVAAAAAHWGPRFVHNGTDHVDFARTLSRISRWDDWCREWGRTAEEYEELATTAEESGHLVTARAAWRQAGLAWHWAKFVFVVDPVQQRDAHDRAVAAYAKGADGLDPPGTRVLVPYGGAELPAYLRVPRTELPPPVVVMAPGLDSVKEELQATAEYFCDRGMATLALDGPGQGESEYELAIEPAYEHVASAALDFCAGLREVDASRAGMFGVSLGGYYAARAMAFEDRFSAGVDLAGPYRFDLGWDELPPMTRDTLRHRSRSVDDHAARAFAARLSLEDAAARITKPLLVVHGGQDRIVGPAHAERLAAEAPGAELVMVADGNHGVTNHAFASRSHFADWMADRLTATPPAG
ncbi:MAG TPA: alpha/beta hydrolase [Acidimicrobiales bacterium]|nr:alpha/beta hydrolase [Acidimicrobiales bacterium]